MLDRQIMNKTPSPQSAVRRRQKGVTRGDGSEQSRASAETLS